MLKKIRVITIFIFACLLTSTQVSAANNQKFVIGFGIGSYDFNEADLDDIDNILYGSEFLEWYIFDEIGIGLRSHKFYKTGSNESNKEFIMATANLSIIWVFYGSSDDLRASAYIGYGPGGVSYSDDEKGLDISETTNDTSSGGVFLDWGGDKWGVRIGYHVISASFEYENNSTSGKIDGSGNSCDLGIRLAF